MDQALTSIYYNVLDRIYLNSRFLNVKKIRTQYDKDEVLKEQLEKVIAQPTRYDIYYQQKTLELTIDDMPEDSRDKRNWFNRIEIDKSR